MVAATAADCPVPPPPTHQAPLRAGAVDAIQYGLKGDGRTDNTQAFRHLLSKPGLKIRLPKGDYLTGKFSIPNDTTLLMDRGTIIRDSGKLDKNERLINITGRNVHISGVGAKVVADRSSYRSGEQRHGIYIWGAQSVLIEGLESNGHGGDGFYIGGPRNNPSSDIVLSGVSTHNNRRQGLSITSARRVDVLNSNFINANGTPPEFGIDIEPNEPQDIISQIRIVCSNTSENRGGGILIYLYKLNATSSDVDIRVRSHQSSRDQTSLSIQNTGKIRGIIQYDSGTSEQAKSAAIQLINIERYGARVEINNLAIRNSNAGDIDQSDPQATSAITVARNSKIPVDSRLGNLIILNPTIIDTSVKPRIAYPLWIQGRPVPSAQPENIVIENLNSKGTRNNFIYWSENKPISASPKKDVNQKPSKLK